MATQDGAASGKERLDCQFVHVAPVQRRTAGYWAAARAAAFVQGWSYSQTAYDSAGVSLVNVGFSANLSSLREARRLHIDVNTKQPVQILIATAALPRLDRLHRLP